MRTHSKLALASLVAAAVFSVAVGTANARSFRVSEQNFEDIWTSMEFNAAGSTVRCPFTILGHYEERTFAKVVNSIIGIARHIEFGTCTGGTITVLNETLPWRLSYQGFAGRLPNILGIRYLLLRLSARVRPEGLAECLAATSVEHPADAEATLSSGTVTSFRLDETIRIPLSGGFTCSLAGEATLSGTAEVRNLPRLGALTVTLI